MGTLRKRQGGGPLTGDSRHPQKGHALPAGRCCTLVSHIPVFRAQAR